MGSTSSSHEQKPEESIRTLEKQQVGTTSSSHKEKLTPSQILTTTTDYKFTKTEANNLASPKSTMSLDTPIEMLDELKPGLIYALVSPPHDGPNAIHVVDVNVNGHVFTGVGLSPSLAKNRAALAALSALYPEKLMRTNFKPQDNSLRGSVHSNAMSQKVSSSFTAERSAEKCNEHKIATELKTDSKIPTQPKQENYNLSTNKLPCSENLTNQNEEKFDLNSFDQCTIEQLEESDSTVEKNFLVAPAACTSKTLRKDTPKAIATNESTSDKTSCEKIGLVHNLISACSNKPCVQKTARAISNSIPEKLPLITSDPVSLAETQEPLPTKDKQNISTPKKSLKTPMGVLHSIRQGCVYKLVSACPNGATHRYVISVNVGNHVFCGEGQSTILAKHKAACNAISALYPHKMQLIDPNYVSQKPGNPKESKTQVTTIKSESVYKNVSNKEGQPIFNLSPDRKRNTKKMTPMDLLNQLKPGIIYDLISHSSSGPDYSFIAAVNIDGRCFTGESKSTAERDILKKKLAKHRAARAAINGLYPDKMSLLIDDPEWIPQTPMPLSRTSERDPMSLRNTSLTPTEMLASLRNDCVYQLVSSQPNEPTHEHTFSVSFNGRTFNGVAKTKQLAKHRAARAAISAVYPDKMKLVTTDPECLPSSPICFLSNAEQENITAITPSTVALKSPMDMLDSLRSGCVYKIVSSSVDGANYRYRIAVNVGNYIFHGEAKSTILAKHRAARDAILTLFPEKMKFVTADPQSVPDTPKYLSSKAEKANSIASISSNNTLKSPMEMLDSLALDYVYLLVSTSRDGYVISVSVGSHVFRGEGPSTILAKNRAAQAAISALFPEKMRFVTADPEYSLKTWQNMQAQKMLLFDSSSDAMKSVNSEEPNHNSTSIKLEPIFNNVNDKEVQPMGVQKLSNHKHSSKNMTPIDLLNQLKTGLTYNLFSPPSNGPLYTNIAYVYIDGRSFRGESKSTAKRDIRKEKLAKHRAARAAIEALYPDKMSLLIEDQEYSPQTHLPLSRTSERDAISLRNTLLTPTEMLASLRNDCVYQLVSSQPNGPTHEHTFSVSFNGRTFNGVAKTKLSAKHRAARAAISALYPDKMKLITDDLDHACEENDSNKIKKSYEKTSQDLLPDIKCEYVENLNNNLLPAFTCKFQHDGSVYMGSGTSKKNAKAAAISNYLLKKHHIMTQTETNAYCSDSLVLNPIFADKISKIVNDKYLEVAKDFPEHSKKAVHSAIVMTKSNDFSDAEVLNITTGTKCINGGYLSYQGATLNDCHAEVVSRRGLISYFYDQLMLHAKPQTANYSVFILKNNQQGFELKPGIKFHLYVSTSCCGDARVFSPYDEEYSEKNLNRQSRGQLRAKIESGEGTVPVKSSNDIQTWDGIMGGKKLITMSCSDKVAKWNVVGVQGSLLTLFLDPIYLYSITVGSLFHPMHTKRALYGRIEQHLPNLPAPFKHNKILMNTIASQEPRVAAEPPIYSSNWLIHDPQPEIINSNTGKSGEKKMSRLCKMSLFLKFKLLLTLNLPPRTHLDKQLNVYLDLKKSSTDYNITKEIFYKACADADLGKWVKKPMELDDFEIDFNIEF